MDYDLIVVGARCAGSPLAMLLARAGHRVLVVDRAQFPSDIISSHYIHAAGIARLKQWGLLERVAASTCPPVYRNTADFGDFRLVGYPPAAQGVRSSYCVRRTYLDKILVDAAAEAGAEVREGFTVEDLLFDNGVVAGTRGHSRHGGTVAEHARIVIGADGMHSLVARKVGAETYDAVPTLTCSYYAYWSGLEVDGAELYPRNGRFFVAAPTNDNLTMINVLAPRAEFHRFRSDIERHFLDTLDLAPEFAERVRQAKRETRFFGTADAPNFFRHPYGPGWALAGDAGYHRDAMAAQGITDAFRDADVLAETLQSALTGECAMTEALAQFHRRRDAAVSPMYTLVCNMARLRPLPPEQRALLEALQGNQPQTDRYFGTIAGSVALDDFYSPENVQGILSARSIRSEAMPVLA